ncbi:MAG: hypothetical protein QOG20_6193, partial [Pseudonocardiales bacterium]|nr:hypothetical protein [Pseudonocardiales bacterium]
MAAAVTGGALAAALPVVAVTSAPAAGTDTAALKLTSDAAADAASRVASVVPVGPVADPEPPEISVSGLLKSAGLADVARRAAEEAAREGSAD